MKITDYTASIEASRVKADSCDKLDYTPLFVPTGCELPETSQQAIARIMLSSGIISQDDFLNMIGVTYDGDFETGKEPFDFEDWEDDFKQSAFAEYESDLPLDNDEIRLETKPSTPETVSPTVSETSTARPELSNPVSETGVQISGDDKQSKTS